LSEWFKLDAASRDQMRVKAVDCFNKRFEIGHSAQSLLDIVR
jgi:hypothetical protein